MTTPNTTECDSPAPGLVESPPVQALDGHGRRQVQRRRAGPVFRHWPQLRLRVLLLGLPLAGGAGLALHILAGTSLLLGIAGVAVIGGAVWLVVTPRLSPGSRSLLQQRARVGMVAGLAGTVAYDLARYGVVALFSMSFQPFHVFSIFGELFIGPGHRDTTIFMIGLLYHLSNGTFFGVAYTLAFNNPSWRSGAVWGIALELCMATLYPSWLRIQMLGEFLQISAIGHVVYGTVLGLVARAGASRVRSREIAGEKS